MWAVRYDTDLDNLPQSILDISRERCSDIIRQIMDPQRFGDILQRFSQRQRAVWAIRADLVCVEASCSLSRCPSSRLLPSLLPSCCAS